jgi:hypothetical protein
VVREADGQPVFDHRVVVEALQLLVAVDERRARLCGLDAPRRQAVQVVTEKMVDAEIAELQAKLDARAVREALTPPPRAIGQSLPRGCGRYAERAVVVTGGDCPRCACLC